MNVFKVKSKFFITTAVVFALMIGAFIIYSCTKEGNDTKLPSTLTSDDKSASAPIQIGVQYNNVCVSLTGDSYDGVFDRTYTEDGKILSETRVSFDYSSLENAKIVEIYDGSFVYEMDGRKFLCDKISVADKNTISFTITGSNSKIPVHFKIYDKNADFSTFLSALQDGSLLEINNAKLPFSLPITCPFTRLFEWIVDSWCDKYIEKAVNECSKNGGYPTIEICSVTCHKEPPK